MNRFQYWKLPQDPSNDIKLIVLWWKNIHIVEVSKEKQLNNWEIPFNGSMMNKADGSTAAFWAWERG